jgi:uncharacterized protein (TIGR02597 family)
MIKTPTKFIALLSGAAFLMSSAFAQGVTTAPVGYVSFPLAANSDLKVGLPMQSSKSFSGAVSSVLAGDVTVGGTVSDLTTEPHFLLVTSDNGLQGNWYTITGATGSVISVAEDLALAGLTSTDTVCAVKFWTLDALFPGGGAVPASSNVFAPVAQVLLNDATATGINLTPASAYLYHDGAQGPAGWYNAGNPAGGLAGDAVINPETFIIVRNNTVTAATIIMSGAVPASPIATSVLSRSAGQQDSLIFNPFPSAITLGASGLDTSTAVRASSNVFAPLDQVLLFDANSTGLNNTPISAYLYHDGAQGPAGWYDAGNPAAGLQDAVEIPAGAPVLIRRAIGSDELVTWTPSLPYTL